MGQYVGLRGPLRQRKLPLGTGTAHEVGDSASINIVECRAGTGAFVERAVLDYAHAFQVIHQTCVERVGQVGSRGESPPDQLRPGLAHEGLHLRVTGGVLVAFDEDQTLFPGGGGAVELAFGGRQALGVLVAVLVAEQAQVYVATVHLFQIDLIGPAARGGQVLEQEHVEEAAQEGIALDVVLQRPSLGGEFLLYRTDEDLFLPLMLPPAPLSLHTHRHVVVIHSSA